MSVRGAEDAPEQVWSGHTQRYRQIWRHSSTAAKQPAGRGPCAGPPRPAATTAGQPASQPQRSRAPRAPAPALAQYMQYQRQYQRHPQPAPRPPPSRSGGGCTVKTVSARSWPPPGAVPPGGRQYTSAPGRERARQVRPAPLPPRRAFSQHLPHTHTHTRARVLTRSMGCSGSSASKYPGAAASQ